MWVISRTCSSIRGQPFQPRNEPKMSISIVALPPHLRGPSSRKLLGREADGVQDILDALLKIAIPSAADLVTKRLRNLVRMHPSAARVPIGCASTCVIP